MRQESITGKGGPGGVVIRRTLTRRYKICLPFEDVHFHQGDGRCATCGAPWRLHPTPELDAAARILRNANDRVARLASTDAFLIGAFA